MGYDYKNKRKVKKYNKKNQSAETRATKAIEQLTKKLVVDTGLSIMNKAKEKVWTTVIADLNNLNIINPVMAGNVNTNFVIELTSIPNVAEYLALFNSYKIEKVKFTFTADVLPPDNQFIPVMYASKWTDSSMTTPITDDFEQMDKVYQKIFSNAHRAFSVTVVPYALDEFFDSVVTTGYGKIPSNKQWFDVHSGSGINFYCLTTLIPLAAAYTLGSNFSINVDIEYTVSFKDTR